MRTIRWSFSASQQLIGIYDFIAHDRPEAAAEFTKSILDTVERLAEYPLLGRPGREAGTRELVVSPFVIVYRSDEQVVDVQAIYHGRQRILDAKSASTLGRSQRKHKLAHGIHHDLGFFQLDPMP